MYFRNPAQPENGAVNAARRSYERSLDALDDLLDGRAADDEVAEQRNRCADLLELLEAVSEGPFIEPDEDGNVRVTVAGPLRTRDITSVLADPGPPTDVVDWSRPTLRPEA